MFGRYVGKIGACGGLTQLQRAMGILRLPGITAHMYSPNVSNYLLSDGSTGLTTVDGVTGLVLDGIGVKTQLSVSQDLTEWTAGGAFGNWYIATATTSTITATAGFGARCLRFPVAPGSFVLFSAVVVEGTTPGMVSLVFGDSGAGYLSEVSAISQASGQTAIGGIAPPGSAFVELVIRAVDAGLTVGFASLSAFSATGIPAKQPTTAYKPVKRCGLLNRLLYAADYSNPAWTKQTCSCEPGYPDPFGGNSAQRNTISAQYGGAWQAIGVTSGGAYTYAQWVRHIAGNTAIGLTQDSGGAVQLPIAVDGSWQLFCFPFIASSAYVQLQVQDRVASGQPTVVDLGPCGLFDGTLTANQILAQGGIPLTTSGPASNPDVGKYWWEFGEGRSLALAEVPFQMEDDHFAVVCFKLDTVTVNQGIFYGGHGTGWIASIYADSGGAVRIWYWNDASISFNLSVGSVAAGEVLVVGLRCASGVVTGWKNTTNAGTLTPTGVFTVTSAGVGTHPSLAPMTGGIYDIAFGKGTVSDAQILDLMKAAGQRGGITI